VEGWHKFYHAKPFSQCPGGIPSGRFCLTSWESGRDAQHKEAKMNINSSSIPSEVAVTTISTLRREWQVVDGNESLICIKTSVGLLLADIVIGLGLKQVEQQAALGIDLYRELEQAGVLAAEHDVSGFPNALGNWIPEAWVQSQQ